MSNQTTGQPLYKGKEPEVGGIPSTATAGTGGDLGSQAKGMFEQVTSAVQVRAPPPAFRLRRD